LTKRSTSGATAFVARSDFIRRELARSRDQQRGDIHLAGDRALRRELRSGARVMTRLTRAFAKNRRVGRLTPAPTRATRSAQVCPDATICRHWPARPNLAGCCYGFEMLRGGARIAGKVAHERTVSVDRHAVEEISSSRRAAGRIPMEPDRVCGCASRTRSNVGALPDRARYREGCAEQSGYPSAAGIFFTRAGLHAQKPPRHRSD